MRMLGVTMGMAQRAVASGNRMFEILDRDPAIKSPPDAPSLPAGGGEVQLRGVTLRYGGSSPALSDVDLTLEAGKTVALVGPSGSGKTSLVALIARLYDPSEGTVLVDGADVRDVDLVSLRSEIAFVADDSFLFTASVAENIAYAHPEASRVQVEAAARRAQADAFIRELPEGYETRVGERGLTLSGGQRQRIAIARALLADPRVLILDDATSSVDATHRGGDQDWAAGGDGGAHNRSSSPTASRPSPWPMRWSSWTRGESSTAAPTRSCCSAAASTSRSPSTALPTRSSCSATSSTASRWPSYEHAGQGPKRKRRGKSARRRWIRSERGHLDARPAPSTARIPSRVQAIMPPETSTFCSSRSGGWSAARISGPQGALDDRLLRPYRGRMTLMFVALLIETGAGLAPPYLAGRAIDAGIRAGDLSALDLTVAAFVARRHPLRRRHLRGDLPGRLGRHPGAPGPARAPLLPHPVDVDRLLHPPQPRRPDLADDQRRRGAQPAGHHRRRDDVLQHPDPGRGGRDPALARREAGAGHLPHLPAAGYRQPRLPDRLGRRLPGDAGADRRRHRLPAGDAERRAGGAQLRPGAAARRR